MSRDPVFQSKGKWYFHTPESNTLMGPFDTEEVARRNLQQYTDYLKALSKNQS